MGMAVFRLRDVSSTTQVPKKLNQIVGGVSLDLFKIHLLTSEESAMWQLQARSTTRIEG
jgi:hypothetical protein